MFKYPAIYYVLLLLCFAFVGWQHATPKRDVERATFLLKCVYEWGLSNEQCEGVLEGEPVPPFPDDSPDC